MKLYTCDHCNNVLYFENTVCLKCGYVLGFDPHKLDLLTLVASSQQNTYQQTNCSSSRYRFCANMQYGTCNWVIAENDANNFCVACQLNRTIPPLSGQNLERWKKIEVAKHRLVYSLLRLNLPVFLRIDQQNNGLAFDFLADISPEKRVMTGHNEGVITLNIEEADEAERVKNKLDLGERYRTLLGHFRHEVGHYYWDIRIKNSDLIEKFRALFGDENDDYTEALKKYYNDGPKANWADEFISPYATAHPWEDWAESWSHYMHLMDTLETAFYFGLKVQPERQTGARELDTEINRDPYKINDFERVFEMWLPLTFAVNSLNRSMGHSDFYPFVIAPRVVEKLSFIHFVCKTITP
jgi:hypothetical protein